MSCGSNFETSNCVCETLLAIAEAQEQVNPDHHHPGSPSTCTTSCNRSIRELLGGVSGHHGNGNVSPFNTIPVILTSKSTALPYLGLGFRRETSYGSHHSNLVLFETIVFRVVDVCPDTCCATLELLTTECLIDIRDDLADLDSLVAKIQTIAAAIDEPFLSTGICITVDLDCFCAVACLPATTVIAADHVTKHHDDPKE
ncbi:CotY/CotZ family spore coat protein [Peribacillus kribbensis]|uniref:CotY/CotZ family spore coat protein n=1 Tax=Peribacillus kribbensis TaxID=356658 RepID=UPI00040EBFDD|nr:CotY/CotZ family spore coat protein [Peribacillus kribbensis]